MQVQVNTDSSVDADVTLIADVEATVQAALARFSDRVTRVEVHLNDVNMQKGGEDKRCLIEARLAGRNPVAVSHQAATIPLALGGATDKLLRRLDRVLGRTKAR
jgi:hypothetical protein